MQVANYFENLSAIVAYSQTCIALEIGNKSCRNFWIWLGLCLIALMAIFLCKIILREIRKINDINLYHKKLAEKAKVANEDTMNKVRWQAESFTLDAAEQDIVAQIRSSIQSKQQDV